MVCLRGWLVEAFYSPEGACVEEIELRPGGTVMALNFPIGRWHTGRG